MINKLKLLFFSCLFIFSSPQIILAQDNQYVIKSGAAPTITNAAIFLAKELGYFEEQGLNVEFINDESAGASQTVLLASGRLDTGGGGFSSGLWRAISQGEEIKIVACKSYIGEASSHWNLIVRKDLVDNGTYKSLKDLKGFTMTLPALGGSGPEMLLESFLKAGGLSMDDIKIVKMRYGEVNTAFESKQIDATVQNEPYTTKSILDGNAVMVGSGSDAAANWQGAAIFFSPSFVNNHNDLAKKWMIAYIKGIRAYNDAFLKNINKEKIIELLKKHIKIADTKIWEQATPALINPNGFLKVDSIKENIDWCYMKGYIEKKPDINKIVDHSFVEKALKEIGEYK